MAPAKDAQAAHIWQRLGRIGLEKPCSLRSGVEAQDLINQEPAYSLFGG